MCVGRPRHATFSFAPCVLDAHVGKHIFEECILGHLKNKTRLMATNQNHLLPYATRILVLKGGRIAQQGTYEQLVAAGVDFAALAEGSGTAGGSGSLDKPDGDSAAANKPGHAGVAPAVRGEP